MIYMRINKIVRESSRDSDVFLVHLKKIHPEESK